MNLKVSQHKQFADKNGNTINNYKIFYKGRGIWISDTDYKQNPELLTIIKENKTSYISLSEPLNKFYKLVKKTNNKGEFFVLMPMINSEESKNIVAEPEAIYETKNASSLSIPNIDIIDTLDFSDDFNNEPLSSKGNANEKPNHIKPIQTKSETKSDKIQFINTLLDFSSKKKIDDTIRTKIFDLIGSEVGKMGLTKEDVEKIVEEKLHGAKGNKYEESKSPQLHGKLHKPHETYQLLDYFSSNEGGIKNLTHSFNLDFIEYETFINQCKIEFETGVKKYPNVPTALLTRIEEFAFSLEPKWYIRKGEEKIFPKLGWSEPNFIKWYKEVKKHPWENSKYRNEMIIPFRESIRVRSDTGNLIKFIKEIIVMIFGKAPICDININDKSLQSADFYTDVDNLGQAIFEILSTMKDKALKNFCNKIEIGFETDEDYKVLFFTHVDSESSKRSDDKDFLGGNLRTIKNKLWGLCNYEIHAKFPDGYLRKIILTDSKEELNGVFPIDDSIKGFTHILKFY